MRFNLKKYESSRTQNILGKTIKKSNYYLIVVSWLLRRSRFLRILPDWETDFREGRPVKVEITKDPHSATKFYDDDSPNTPHVSIGRAIISSIKDNPDNFIMG